MSPKSYISRLCRLLGFTRQAHYKQLKSQERKALEEGMILSWVAEERKSLSKLGGRKLYHNLHSRLEEHQIQLGRDRFFTLLREAGLLVRRTKRRPYTTNSRHPFRKYSNLIEGFEPDGPHQLLVSDITYLEVGGQFSYLSLVTDAYSRKIVGYRLAPTLEAVYCLDALNKALEQIPEGTTGLIHHSDRGIQYCSFEYTNALKGAKIAISMTQNGDPRENAIAERINGILKDELLPMGQLHNFDQACKEVDKAVQLYNCRRPHMSIDMLTPEVAHQHDGKLQRRWKSYYKTPDLPAEEKADSNTNS